MTIDLPLIWGLLIATAVLMYVVLDGFDLGIGMLFPFLKTDEDRDVAMNTIAPVWDGNETWLILGGGGLFAVFPQAYSLIMTAMYAPVIAMLLALVFRGVAFEFRFRDPAHRPIWDLGFQLGSLVATFCQGIILGAFIQGIPVENGAYAGNWFTWLTPFSFFTGFALVAGYSLLGAAWLVMKTEGDLQAFCNEALGPLTLATVAGIGIVSLWTPLLNETIAARWFSLPNLIFFSPVPLLVLAMTALLLRARARGQEVMPFLYALGLFLLSFVGLAISLYPTIVPPDITIWDAAGPDASLSFLLVGTVVLLPMVLGYTAYAYWVFRGKVRPGDGYH